VARLSRAETADFNVEETLRAIIATPANAGGMLAMRIAAKLIPQT
jgi:hypothetical protein